jgi:putative nucleotidyltransferase with HDIG domain
MNIFSGLASLFSSLRSRLILLILFIILPALALILYQSYRFQDYSSQVVTGEALQMAHVIAGKQNDVIYGARQLLIALSRLPQIQDFHSSECSRLLAEIMDQFPSYANLGVADAQGATHCSALPLVQPVTIHDRAYFQRAMHAGDFAIGDYQIGRITGKPSLNVAYPIVDRGGRLHAVVFAALDLAWLDQLIADVDLPAGSSISIIDLNGTILAHYPDPEIFVGSILQETRLVETILSIGEGGTLEVAGQDGIERLYAFVPLADNPHMAGNGLIAIGIPTAAAYELPNRTMGISLIWMAVIACLSLVAGWAGFDTLLLRHLNLVRQAARRVSDGDLRTRVNLADGPEELQELSLTFDQMAKSLEQQVRERERNLSQVQALREIDLAIANNVDMRIALKTVVEQVIAQLNVDAAAVLVFNSHLQQLEFVAGRGFRDASFHKAQIRLGESYAGRAASQRRLLHIPDLAAEPDGFARSNRLMDEGFIAYFATPLIAKARVKGVLEIFHRQPLNPDQVWFDFLETLAGQVAITIDNAQLFSDLQRATDETVQAYDATIEGWSRALDLRDHETEGHSQRVTEMAIHLARELGVTGQDLLHLRRGALLHDIGKMGVPDTILLKPGPLSEGEWAVMHKHPVHAWDLLFPIAYLRPALDIPYCHHEKWDGSGYPRGLKGEEIPLAARVFAIVDVLDALLSDRPYRPAWSLEEVRQYLLDQSGKHFDPRVVARLLTLLDRGEILTPHPTSSTRPKSS